MSKYSLSVNAGGVEGKRKKKKERMLFGDDITFHVEAKRREGR